MPTEVGRFFEVSEVRLDTTGHIAEVLWSEVNAGANQEVGPPVRADLAEVVDALHDGAQVSARFLADARRPERGFLIFEHPDGTEGIELEGLPSPGRNLSDLRRFDTAPVALEVAHPAEIIPLKTFAVSKVRLDKDGRITDLLWGPVDRVTNDWAAPQTAEPVAVAVQALRSGYQVHALFSSLHGHQPDRQFVVADYDGGLQTIVLAGPSAYEREVHDMDRMDDSTPA
jgi:hypothetical protein